MYFSVFYLSSQIFNSIPHFFVEDERKLLRKISRNLVTRPRDPQERVETTEESRFWLVGPTGIRKSSVARDF